MANRRVYRSGQIHQIPTQSGHSLYPKLGSGLVGATHARHPVKFPVPELTAATAASAEWPGFFRCDFSGCVALLVLNLPEIIRGQAIGWLQKERRLKLPVRIVQLILFHQGHAQV